MGDKENLLELVGTWEMVMAMIRDLITGAYQKGDANGKTRPQAKTDKRIGPETEWLNNPHPYPHQMCWALWFWNWESCVIF